MKCPKCGHEFKSPVAVAGGKAGGKARVPKGFASPAVMRKALTTRKKRSRHNAPRERPAVAGTLDGVVGGKDRA